VRGSVFKRCGCRHPETDRQLGARCPNLGKKNHGSWWARFDAPPGPDGKRHQPKIGPYRTKDEAQAALTKELDKIGSGPYINADRTLTFGDYLDQWLAGKVALKKSTYRSYVECVRLYFKPGLGHVRLVDLRDHHFEELYSAMRKIGRIGADERSSHLLRRLLQARSDMPTARRPLRPARIRRIHAVAMSALNTAVAKKKISANPAEHIELASGRAPRALAWTDARVAAWRRTGRRPSPVMVWTPKQAGAFLDFATDDRLYPLWHLIAYRGLRRAEAVGLAMIDVDLDAGTVTIRETLVDADDEYEDPKSRSSERTIGLDKATIAVLRAWLAREEEERNAWAADWVDSGRLFTKDNGEALDPDTVSQRFDRLIERTGRANAQCGATTRSGERCRRVAPDGATCPKHGGARSAEVPPTRTGLPPIRLHDLRHTAASLTYLATRDLKLVSELLGHSSIQITGDIYTTVFAEVDRAAAEAVAAIVPRRRPVETGEIDGTAARP
jgi:integrase